MIVTSTGVLLASSGWRPGTLLNILQCTRQSLMTKNYPAQIVSSIPVEKSYCKEILVLASVIIGIFYSAPTNVLLLLCIKSYIFYTHTHTSQ